MSTGARRMARPADNTIAMTATRTVMGRRSARMTRNI
jgi:hypothetical protein